MDYPKTVANVNLLAGKFTDGNPSGGTPASLVPAEWLNNTTDEILNVLAAAGIAPDEANNGQLIAAITKITSGRVIATKTFIGSGTYTPTAGTNLIHVAICGGGGSGGGAPATTSAQNAVGSGGGSGGYLEAWILIADIVTPVPVTIASGGSGTYGNGNAGGASTFGSYLTANGGSGGIGTASAPPFALDGGSAGGASSTVPTLPISKGAKGIGAISVALGAGLSGPGGASGFGIGGSGSGTSGSSSGGAGTHGAGGGGATAATSSAAQLSGGGGNGVCIVTEFA